MIANVIHSRSRRAGQTMVKLNCAAFPQTMIEAELFGYVKGAFTGATNDFPGMIAEARRRHAFSGRNLGDAAGAADPFFARAAGARIPAAREHAHDEGGFSGRSRRPIGRLRRRSQRTGCAPICITGSTPFRLKFRRCASGRKIFHRWSRPS